MKPRNRYRYFPEITICVGVTTKLIGEARGDIGKLFVRWDQFGWHRVTVYGDVKEPLAEFGKALGLEVINEA